jgi:eukaryotic-like serine/threonine-protein kinase
LGERGVYYDPVLSPDGRAVLLERADPNTHVGDLIRVDTTTGTVTRVIHDPGFDNVGLWSPDGRRIVFSSDRDGLSTLFQVNADGSGAPTKLLSEPGMLAYAVHWSSDGQTILFMGTDATRVPRLWALSLSPTPRARQLSVSRGAERDGALSPDGRWIAYASDESGDWQVYVRPWPSLASPTQVSLRGGVQPQWRRDGKELFYATVDGNIMSAAVSETAGQFQPSTPTMLFAPSVNVFDGFRNRFTVTNDGQRLLVLKPVVDRRLSPITAVINWTELMSPR